MKFNMPTASRKHLDELLTFLGDRAKDFKKCFDTESEWCLKYAAILVRGIKNRKLEYAEGHHVVPASFYGKRRTVYSDENNLVTLSYGEHLYAHYCAAQCGIGRMQEIMANAFFFMYKLAVTGKRPVLPEEKEFIESLSELEVNRIRAMRSQTRAVEAAGRAHKWEGLTKYNRDYREANKEHIARVKKERYERNKETVLANNREWRKANPDKMDAYRAKWNATNRIAYSKIYRDSHSEELKAYKKEWYKKHSDQWKAYVARKQAAGYRHRKDPVTGNVRWVFVGNEETATAK
jgi:hypothetical protein